jgi:hypothetical protein
MAIKTQPDLFSEVINDPQMLSALEDWLEAKEDLEPIRKAFGDHDKRVKGLMAELEPGSYRCGRFTIAVTERAAKHVEFDVGDTRRVAIRLFEED